MKNQWIRWFKWIIGIGLGLGLLGIAVAAIWIPRAFPPSRIRQLLIQKLSQTFHRPVNIQTVQFNVFQGFELHSLTIANRTGPGWSKQNFIQAQNISITYDLLPLLWGQIELGQIELNQPSILIERHHLNEVNFDLFSSSNSKTQSTGKTPLTSTQVPQWNLSIHSIQIRQGRLCYINQLYSSAQTVILPDFNMHIQNISTQGQRTHFSFNTTLRLDQTTYHFSTTGNFRLLMAQQLLKSLSIQGNLSGINYSLQGSAAHIFTDFSPTMQGTASLEMIKILGLIPKTLPAIPTALKLSGPVTVQFKVQGHLNTNLQFDGTANATQASIQYGKIFLKKNGKVFTASFQTRLGQHAYYISQLHAVFQHWKLSGHFQMTHLNFPGQHPNYQFQLDSDQLPLKSIPTFIPVLKTYAFSGSAQVHVSGQGNASSLSTLQVHGMLNFHHVEIQSVQDHLKWISHLSGQAQWVRSTLNVPKIQFDLLNEASSLQLQAVRFTPNDFLNWAQTHAAITFQFYSQAIDFGKLYQKFSAESAASTPSASGSLLSSSATTGSPIPPGLSVKGTFTFGSFIFRKLLMKNINVSVQLHNRFLQSSARFAAFQGTGLAGLNLECKRVPIYAYALNLTSASAQNAINEAVASFVVKQPNRYENKIAGTMNFKFSGRGSSFTTRQAEASMVGKGSFVFSNIRIQGLALLDGVMSKMKNKQVLTMRQLVGAVAVKKSQIALNAESMGSSGRLHVYGTMNFDGYYDPALWIHAYIQASDIDAQQLFQSLPTNVQGRLDVSRLANAQGEIPLFFKLTGPVDQPPSMSSFDVSPLLKNLAASYVKQESQKLGNLLKSKIQNLFH